MKRLGGIKTGLCLLGFGVGLVVLRPAHSAALPTSKPPKESATAAATVYRTEVALSVDKIGSQETALGGLVADALREAAHADAAFIPAASFRSDASAISPGSFSPNDVVQMLDFRSETIAVVKLTGAQIRRALAHAFLLYPQENSSFLQFSGLTVTIAPNAEDQERIVSVRIGGQPLVDTQTYRVAMPLTLANGALAYFKYWDKSDIVQTLDTSLEQAVKDYLKNHPVITKGEDRLVEKGP